MCARPNENGALARFRPPPRRARRAVASAYFQRARGAAETEAIDSRLWVGYTGLSMHSHEHAFTNLNARDREGLVLVGRRSTLKAGLAGLAGLTLPGLLETRADAAKAGRAMSNAKSVILLWMTGGPSHIDTWD